MTSSESTETEPLSWQRWNARYGEANTPWDLGQPAPGLVATLQGRSKPLLDRIAVLGCGRGHDAVFLAQQGFEVVGIDFSPLAIAAAQELAQLNDVTIDWQQQDIFNLASALHGTFDIVFEHTCFCAIAIEQRAAYCDVVHQLLKPQGQLWAVFFTHNRPGGPPFGSSTEELRSLFESRFTIQTLEPIQNSIPKRQDEEHWGVLQRRD
ncbi:MAG: methyltransferase domain-containing protein [Spirulina sp. SIO3F2]|nr:methyltransferase domain-containing protein [Spirulina sp. SIO3F2]